MAVTVPVVDPTNEFSEQHSQNLANANAVNSNFSYDSDYLYNIARQARLTGDEAWYEKWLEAMQSESFYNRAVEYDKFVRSNSYQMMVEDLKKAGLNPYLALNSLGGFSGANIQGQASGYGAVSSRAKQQQGQAALLKAILSIFSSAGALAKIVSLFA